MALIYIAILAFVPKLFKVSLIGLFPWLLGMLGRFLVPDINPF